EEPYIDLSDVEIDSEEYKPFDDETNPRRFDNGFGPSREVRPPMMHDRRWIKKQVVIAEEDAAGRRLFHPRCSSAVALAGRENNRLFVAARCGDTSEMRGLINAGVSPSCCDVTLDSPLHWAAIAGEVKAARLLIQEGANINAETEKGRTPLHNAVVTSQTRVVLELLAAGARTDVADHSGFTALDVAMHLDEHGYTYQATANRMIAEELRKAGAEQRRSPSPERSNSPDRHRNIVGQDEDVSGEDNEIDRMYNYYNATRDKKYDLLNLFDEIKTEGEEIHDRNMTDSEWDDVCDGAVQEVDGPGPPKPRKPRAKIPIWKKKGPLTELERERIDLLGKKAIGRGRKPR
ncbi:ankyrin repeat-containing domain protein, partial [Baffinella frigidus]